MRIRREELLSSLQSVSPGIAQGDKGVVEQSNTFVFKDGRVHTFNDEMACSCKSLLGSGEGAVIAKPLLAILEKLTEEEIEVSFEEGELLIRGKRKQSGVRRDKEITLPINVVDKPKTWNKLHEDFLDAINIVYRCAGKDDNEFAITCVHIHPKWIEACDNYQICRWKIKTGVKQSMLVRQNSIRHVTQLGMTEFSETENWIHFRNPSGVILSCRRFTDEYPDLGDFIKVGGTKTELPKGLVDSVDKANVFSSENVDNNQVMIELRPNKLKIKGQGILGWYSETKKVSYDGPDISFRIAPQILSDLVDKYNECVISEDRIRVDGGAYQYVSCLSKPTEESKEEKDE